MSCDEKYYLILHVGGHFVKDPYFRYIDKFDNKGEWSTYGDVEEINGVEADGEGVTDAQFEADEHGGGQSVGVGNVVAPANGEEESKAVLDGNKTEVWDSDEHGSLVGSNED
ncbi:hypothetical protein Goklo_019999 [Gossypium klotzschianum]|uniref:Uncharacterized protein n=1 Tax=Gossypium klotzschianum TaxID=34286 RepID=A0A7J8UQM4_9ROSI|nr:hypothetical protein [Gossypium klotzschianum]